MPANEEALQTLYVEVKAKLDKLEAGLRTAEREVKTSSQKMADSFKSVGTAFGLAFGAQQVVKFMKDSLNAYMQSEAALKKLEIALGRNASSLSDYAAALQKVTAFEDDEIVNAMALLSMYIKDEAQIKQLTKAVLDFAAAKDIDLKSAADLVAKSIGTETNALARYGVSVEGAVGSTERFNSLMGGMARFSGQAAGQLDTVAGKIKKFQNEWDDFLEKTGATLLPYFEKLIGTLKTTKKELEFIQGLLDSISRFINTGSFKTKIDMVSPHQQNKKIGKNLVSPHQQGPEVVTDEEKKALQDLLAKQAEFYNAVMFLSEKYYTWKRGQIEKEKNEFIKAGISKADAEAAAQKQLFDLELQRFKNFEDIKNAGLEELPNLLSTIPEAQAISLKTIKEITEEYKYQLQLAVDISEEERQRLLKSLNDVSQIGYALEDAFSKSGNTLLSKLNQALQIALNISKAINSDDSSVLGTIASIIPGLGFIGSLFGLHKGGTVVNSGGRVSVGPGFASGTDFRVPSGYPNDSYPIRVESGERVTVTPANRIAESMGGFKSGDVSQIVNAIKAMNMNLLKKKMTVNISSKVDGLKFYEGKIAPAQNRSNRSGKNVSVI